MEKPILESEIKDVQWVPKSILFSDTLSINKSSGILDTSLLYSQGSDIYQIACQLPLGLYVNEFEKDLNQPIYDIDGSNVKNPKWIFPNEIITKIIYADTANNHLVATISEKGSLAWFKEDSKVPIHHIPETDDPSINSLINPISVNESTSNDLVLSKSSKFLVKTQNNYKNQSFLKLIDNSERIGKILNIIPIADAINTYSVKFHNDTLFSCCSNDNKLRFFDLRSGGVPIWTFDHLIDNSNDYLTAYDVSPTIDTLLATGSKDGVIKLWDLRSLVANSNSIQESIFNFYHTDEDPICDLHFSPTLSTDFLSVGDSGNIYHWDLNEMTKINEYDTPDYIEETQQNILKFLHTGGGRRSLGELTKKNTVTWNTRVNGVVGCVDFDGLITVYKNHNIEETDSDLS